MRMNQRSRPNAEFRIPNSEFRNGFTLIELMVVVSIIVALAAITLLFYPKREVRLAADGADKLQTYIAQARSRALRDQAPRGIRLLPDANGKYTEIVLVEVPEPIVAPPGTKMTVLKPASSATIRSTVMFSPAGTLGSIGLQAGDYLEIMYGAGSIHRIETVSGDQVVLASKVPAAEITDLAISDSFRFIRQARPLMGEPTLQLPDTVYVMPTRPSNPVQGTVPGSLNIPVNGAIVSNPNVLEIIFSPSGQVINSPSGPIVLWLTDDNNVSKPTLLTVYSRTGACAAHPTGPATDLFQYTKDGKSSGQ